MALALLKYCDMELDLKDVEKIMMVDIQKSLWTKDKEGVKTKYINIILRT